MADRTTATPLPGVVLALGEAAAFRTGDSIRVSTRTPVSLELRPTEVLTFGNPPAGTALMQAAQMVGIDLLWLR